MFSIQYDEGTKMSILRENSRQVCIWVRLYRIAREIQCMTVDGMRRTITAHPWQGNNDTMQEEEMNN